MCVNFSSKYKNRLVVTLSSVSGFQKLEVGVFADPSYLIEKLMHYAVQSDISLQLSEKLTSASYESTPEHYHQQQK